MVVRRLHVNCQGSVDAVEVATTGANASLDEAACAGLGRWRFRPATHDGMAHACSVDQRVTFQLRALSVVRAPARWRPGAARRTSYFFGAGTC